MIPLGVLKFSTPFARTAELSGRQGCGDEAGSFTAANNLNSSMVPVLADLDNSVRVLGVGFSLREYYSMAKRSLFR